MGQIGAFRVEVTDNGEFVATLPDSYDVFQEVARASSFKELQERVSKIVSPKFGQKILAITWNDVKCIQEGELEGVMGRLSSSGRGIANWRFRLKIRGKVEEYGDPSYFFKVTPGNLKLAEEYNTFYAQRGAFNKKLDELKNKMEQFSLKELGIPN